MNAYFPSSSFLQIIPPCYRDNKYYHGNDFVSMNPWIEIELNEPVAMSGLGRSWIPL